MSQFSTLDTLPDDPIYGMQVIYKRDPRIDKINLSIGVCLDDTGKLLCFEAVKQAEKHLSLNSPSKEYLPISGHPEYLQRAQELIFGTHPPSQLFSVQSVGGTGALYLSAKVLKRAKIERAYIPSPSWPNHKPLFEAAGIQVASYPYYNPATNGFDLEEMLRFIATLASGSAIILQASCHNPTGIDPTQEEWRRLSHAIKKQKLLPLFDLAYVGLGDDLATDTQAIRLFLEDGHEMLICSTFAKSFGLYNDRVALLTVANSSAQAHAILSHLRAIARSTYSSPPAHGALVVNTVLADPKLRELWQSELATTCQRLKEQRRMLFEALKRAKATLHFSHLMQTKGLFCLLPLTLEQVTALQEKCGLYVALDGRISLASITEENVQSIAEALATIK